MGSSSLLVNITLAAAAAKKTPVEINGLDSSQIAIHILATAKHARGKDGSGGSAYDYFDHRIWGSVVTWGKDFPKLTFVLGGTGTHEVKLGREGHGTATCRVKQRSVDDDEAVVERSICDGFDVLRFAKCTNDYYGHSGPCCRCQESMRWVLANEHILWYAFMDDDVYVRAPPVVAMLSELDPRKPLAISGNANLRGFAPGMWPWLKEKGCDSASNCVFAFPWMQPAFFSAAALDAYAPAIDADGLTTECEAFHVTHDVGLGILNWMRQIPTLILGPLYAGSTNKLQKNADPPRWITVHAVRRHTGDHVIAGLKGPSGPQGRYANHASLRQFYSRHDAADSNYAAARRLGSKAARVRPVVLNGFNSTRVARTQPDLNAFVQFTPDDCGAVDDDHASRWCRTFEKNQPHHQGDRRRLQIRTNNNNPRLDDLIFISVRDEEEEETH